MDIVVEGNVMSVVGQVDGRGTAELRDRLHALVACAAGDVVLDLGRVESIDVTALRVIAVTSRAMSERGPRHLLLRNCSPLVRRLLHLSHLRCLVLFEATV